MARLPTDRRFQSSPGKSKSVFRLSYFASSYLSLSHSLFWRKRCERSVSSSSFWFRNGPSLLGAPSSRNEIICLHGRRKGGLTEYTITKWEEKKRGKMISRARIPDPGSRRGPSTFHGLHYYRFKYKLLIIKVFTMNFVHISLSYCKFEKSNLYFLDICSFPPAFSKNWQC